MSELAMNITMRQNRSLLSSRKKEKFKGNNRDTIYNSNNKEENCIQFKRVSKNELNEIKNSIRIRAKKAQRRELIYYGTLFGIATVLILLFLYNQ